MSNVSSVRFRIHRDVWIGLGTIAFSLLYWLAADDIPISPLDGQVNAAMIPKTLASAMVMFSLLLIGRSLLVEWMFVTAARKAAGPVDRPVDEEAKIFTKAEHLKAVGVLVIGIAYLLVLPWLGYIVSMALLIFVVSVYIGAKAGWYSAAVGVVLAVCYYLLFVRLLSIPLPAGLWPTLF
jgi:putative tricarboxylic transport membrane protein